MKTIARYLKAHVLMVAACILFKTVAAFADLMIPRILAIIIDEIVPTEDIKAVYIMGGVMIACALFALSFNIIGNRLSARVSAKFTKDMRHDLFVATVNLDVRATDKIGLSSLTSRLTSDTYNVGSFLGRLLRMGLRAPMILIGGIIITFTLDWRLALIFLLVLPLVCITVYVVTKLSVPVYKEEQKTLDALVRRVDETASGIRVIKALSKVDYEKSRFNKTSEKLSNEEIKAGRITAITTPVNDAIFYLGFCAVVSVGAVISMRTGAEMSGQLLAFMTYFTMVLNGMLAMTRIFVQMSRAVASADRIEEVLRTKSVMPTEELPVTSGEPYIVFDNVSFSYNGRRDNIKNLSLTLDKGQTLGIIGGTGSGKSTVIKLLLRLYDISEGSVRIGGRDVRSIPYKELYSLFGVAYQNDFIPKGSVGENIDFYRGISESSIGGAAEIAQAAEFISELDGGMEYEVATRGANLSGGQRQRLLVARAVAGSPEILILDDSSSALDYKTDKELRSAIKYSVNTTTIIVSQRVASVKNADKILVLDDGEVLGIGTHDELMKNISEYRDIAKVQMA